RRRPRARRHRDFAGVGAGADGEDRGSAGERRRVSCPGGGVLAGRDQGGGNEPVLNSSAFSSWLASVSPSSCPSGMSPGHTLVPGIHVLGCKRKAWMAGTRPGHDNV